jgi:hypothetical protein
LRAMVCCQNGSLGPAVPAPNGAEQEVPRAVASDARKEIARKEASLILEKSMPNGRSHTEGRTSPVLSLLNTCRRLSSTGPSSESCDQHSSRLFSRLMQDRMTSPRNDGHPKPGTGHRSEQDQILGARSHAESKAGTRAIVVAATVTWRLSRP